MKAIKGYHDLYLKCDVLLLADALEKIRNNTLKSYRLCTSHYLSVLVLSSDAMLKMEKTELELISDSDMYILSEVTKGGISYFSNRYSKANNKYLKYFDPK